MPKPLKKPANKYEKLKKVWYKKLANSGFKDIEKNEYDLVSYDSDLFGQFRYYKDAVQKQDYYYMANHFLNNYNFETELDKIIWEYHANGIGVLQIVKLLEDAKVRKMSHDTAWRIIKRLQNIMKLNTYEYINQEDISE